VSHHEPASADIARTRIYYSQGELCGDRCVHGISSFFQDRQTGLAGQWMSRYHGTVSAGHALD